jgi:hypothetical protein
VIDVAPKGRASRPCARVLDPIIPKGFRRGDQFTALQRPIQDLALTQPNKFEEKYQAILAAKQRDELRRGLEAIARLKGQKEITTISSCSAKRMP